MRSLRYFALILVITLGVSASPRSRDDGPGLPNLIRKIMRFAHFVQPLDELIVPHP
jgi:hypothetical protein